MNTENNVTVTDQEVWKALTNFANTCSAKGASDTLKGYVIGMIGGFVIIVGTELYCDYRKEKKLKQIENE